MNLEEEIRDGYTISIEMKKAWAVQMELAQYLIDVCKKHNLRIWADGGTLLGVVRHKGFIPWDDDIDMFMPRTDYDKLIALADVEFKKPYFLQCQNTEKYYYRGHAQLRKDGTAAILHSDVHSTYHQGIFVDIFCFDNIPDKDTPEFLDELKSANKIKSDLNQFAYRKFHFDSYMWFLRPNTILKNIWLLLKYSIKNPNKEYAKLESIFRKYSNTETKYTNCPCFKIQNYRYTLRKNEWLQETLWMPFEDMLMPVPNGWHEIECTQYGSNYMIPIQAPSVHGGFLVLDAEKSYEEYLPNLRVQVEQKRKEIRIEKIKNYIYKLSSAIKDKF